MIRDGLTMHGSTPAASVAELELRWDAYARRSVELGSAFPNRPGATGLVELADVVDAYVSESRWVIDCPSCGGGAAATVGSRRACCFDCGTILTSVRWPNDRERAAGEAVLLLRPNQARNWTPMNETSRDLRFENITRGYPIPRVES